MIAEDPKSTPLSNDYIVHLLECLRQNQKHIGLLEQKIEILTKALSDDQAAKVADQLAMLYQADEVCDRNWLRYGPNEE